MKRPATISVRVSPGAHQNRLTRFAAGAWYLRIAAPAARGKANQELVRFLSGILGVSADSVVISQGVSSRRKLVTVLGLSTQEIEERLARHVESG